MEYTSYMRNEDVAENKEILDYGFKPIKTDKMDNYILIGYESCELYVNNKLFNFWSNKFMNKVRENRDFRITGWPVMTLVKRNNFCEIQGISM